MKKDIPAIYLRRHLTAIMSILTFCLSPLSALNAEEQPPAPVGPLPTASQVAWQQMETYAFIHFGPNTFEDKEWGYGDASPKVFSPTRLDAHQWAKTCKNAGLRGIIITAKHHDGFCLWPTQYTDYSVRNSTFRDGKGDVIAELAEACRAEGLKMGLYLSPWDRHQAFYGTPFYMEYYLRQLEELLSRYGDIFEVWLDGANGGDGWYGGACEKRTIDRRTYYDFARIHETIYRLQPNAIIFSDAGPGCRWVGNEKGYANATNWSFLRIGEVYPGYDKAEELQSGHADGDTWVAAECDVSIRPGWFYHEKEDGEVKTVEHLVDLYYRSVGHNATLLLNLPVNRDGLIHPIDSARLQKFHTRIQKELSTNLLAHAKLKAERTRGKAFATQLVTDGHYDTYWATPDGICAGTLEFDLRHPTTLNRIMLQEYIPLGQRVEQFVVEYHDGKKWQVVDCGEETTTIGYKRLLRFNNITTRRLRVTFVKSRGPLCISEIGAYYAQ